MILDLRPDQVKTILHCLEAQALTFKPLGLATNTATREALACRLAYEQLQETISTLTERAQKHGQHS